MFSAISSFYQSVCLSRGKSGGYLFFKHIRKSGGTSLRAFFFNVLEYHDQSRTFDLSPVAKAGFASGEMDRKKGGRAFRKIYENHKIKTARKERRKKNRGGETSGYNVHYVEQEFDAVRFSMLNEDNPNTDHSYNYLFWLFFRYADGLAMF